MTAADLGVLRDLVELAEHRGQYVGEVRLEAGHRDVVERAFSAAHEPEVAKLRVDGVVVGRHHSASPAATFFVA